MKFRIDLQQNFKLKFKYHQQEAQFFCKEENCDMNKFFCLLCLKDGFHIHHKEKIENIKQFPNEIHLKLQPLINAINQSKKLSTELQNSIQTCSRLFEDQYFGLEPTISYKSESEIENLLKFSFKIAETQKYFENQRQIFLRSKKDIDEIIQQYQLHLNNIRSEQESISIGDDLVKQLQYKKAITYYEEAIKTNPQNSQALIGIANCISLNTIEKINTYNIKFQKIIRLLQVG